MPLLGDSTFPSGPSLLPARQPTAATTLPPVCPKLSGACTTTSVTMLAKKQPATMPLPVQSGFSGAPLGSPLVRPVGRDTFSKLPPASVDRYRPAPVAA